MTSLRQLARLIGVDEKAVRKAEKAGVFKGALKRGDDGALLYMDVSTCVDLWERSGRRLRGSSSPVRDGHQAPAVASAAVVAPAPAIAAADVFGEQPDSDGEGIPPAPPADAPPSLVEAQIAAMTERARKLRMENDAREGSLVEVQQATRQAFEFARTLRENILNIPARLAAELAAESDGSRVYQRLDGALREALEAVAASLEAPPAPLQTEGTEV